MINFILLILLVSLILYIVLAGADLGAGILEIFKGRKLNDVQEKLITRAMGPVWEANHIWLILVVVILFVGFPKVFKNLSVVLHIPLTAFLVGIVFRGTSFTFRHYDAVKDQSQKYYSLFFSYSSLWTTMWMGIITGALILGQIPEVSTGLSFAELYINPWLNYFCILLGLFLCSLFSLVSSTFLLAESGTYQTREIFRKRAFYSTVLSVLIGASIFIYSRFSEIHALDLFFENSTSMGFFIFSSLLLGLQWFVIKCKKDKFLKFIGATQLTFIFLGWVSAQYPYVYFNKLTDRGLNILNSAAPDATILQLGIALIIGVILIFPPYIYLMSIFKRSSF